MAVSVSGQIFDIAPEIMQFRFSHFVDLFMR